MVGLRALNAWIAYNLIQARSASECIPRNHPLAGASGLYEDRRRRLGWGVCNPYVKRSSLSTFARILDSRICSRVFLGVAIAILFMAIARPVTATAAEPTGTQKVGYARDIRPILADKCLSCHGPDARQRKGKLRLDNRRDATAAAASGSPAIVPGKLEDSELYRRITSDDPEERMPPAKTGKPLTPAEIARLKTWIEQGAEYQGHWAFVLPVRPELPSVKNAGWCRNPIDRFILARLDAEGLSPSPQADKITLIRRLSLDLVGLPPSVEDVDAFVADTRDDAYARLVDRLLDAPQYGERWGRIWLDAARYADSDGYEKDKSRQVSAYRDWVIHALNRDLPYNQFIIDQIAGDLLPGASQDQVVATGFLRNSMINEEGGVDPEQFRMEAMFDRMDCIGKGVLGLTIQCAQCHTHKYDPLTHEEYYRLFAFLNNSHEANVAVYSPDELMRRAEVLRKIREIEDDLRHRDPAWAEHMAAWEKPVANDQPAWTIVRPEIEEESTGGEKNFLLEDGSYLAQGYAPTKHTVEDVGQDRRLADHGLSPGVAQRPEFADGWARPVDQGDGRPDRVPGRCRPGRCAGEEDAGQIRTGHGGHQSAGEAPGSHLRRQERQEARDGSDRLRDRRQG